MELRCCVVDDVKIELDALKEYIDHTPGLVYAHGFCDATEAMRYFSTSRECVDVAFLDIEMPGISGIELAGLIKGRVPVVFVSGHRNFGPETYEVEAIDYLLKPISYDRFLLAALKIFRYYNTLHPVNILPDYLFVPGDSRNSLVKIPYADIAYIQAAVNYSKVFIFVNGKISYSMTHVSLSEFDNILPSTFIRIHKSYIVNIAKIRAVKGDTITLDLPETTLTISAQYIKVVRDRLKPF